MTDPQPRFGADGLVPAVVQDRVDGRVLMLAYMDEEAFGATLATGEVHFHSRSRGRLWRKGETSGNVLRLVSLALDCDGDALLVTVDPHGPTCHRGTRSCFDPDGAPAGTDAPGNSGAPARNDPPVSSGAPAGSGAPATSDPPASSGAPASSDTPGRSDPRAASDGQGFAWLETLWATIASRASERPAGSYTTSLLEGGVDAVGRKVTEEATEVLLAAKDDAVAPSGTTRAALVGEAADLLYHVLVLLAERGSSPAEVVAVLRERHGS